MKAFSLCLLLFLSGLSACDPDEEPLVIDPVAGDWFQPKPLTTFDWRLDEIETGAVFDAKVVDIDAFDATTDLVKQLHNQGEKVVAYVSVGTVEDWRPDAHLFPASVVGNDYAGWEGEKWLDIRNITQLSPILLSRLDMIKDKGFDAVEPDNIDGFEYPDPGFDLKKQDAEKFCIWLIEEAHKRGLSIGQKNAPELAPDLVDGFDWMLTEDAFADDWQQDAKIFIEKGKAVFAVEYTDRMSEQSFFNTVCPIALAENYTAILKDRDLTAGKVSCQ